MPTRESHAPLACLPCVTELDADRACRAAPQEPYLWKSVAEATRKALKIRYQLLPYWESLFAEAKLNGT